MKDVVEILSGAVGGFVLGGLFAKALYSDVMNTYNSVVYELRQAYDKAKSEIELLKAKL